MSLIGPITDFLTGGENARAASTLADVMDQIKAIQTPSAAALQLSPLDQYYSTGTLDPALMEAAQTGPSAYDRQNLSSVPMEVMQQVLARQGEIANSGGMTAQERAKIGMAEDEMNRATAGQRGAIAQDFAGRGIPQSLIAAALQNGTVGQNAQQAHLNAIQAAGEGADRAMQASANQGNLAAGMFDRNANQANTVAAAQNALNQFNAANTQASNMANQNARQMANNYNTTNAQNLANENISGKHQVQIQNQVNAPMTAAQLALQKGNALMGAGNAQAGQMMSAGRQNAAVASGLINAGATLGAAGMGGGGGGIKTGNQAGQSYTDFSGYAYQGGEIPPKQKVVATPFEEGGQVPGMPVNPGDHPANDTVPARLSPGEFVVPRTAMQRPEVRNFLAQNVPTPRPPSAHPSDIASILRALSSMRSEA